MELEYFKLVTWHSILPKVEIIKPAPFGHKVMEMVIEILETFRLRVLKGSSSRY